MVELAQKLLLVHHRIDATLGNDSCLGHFLHRIELLLLLQFYFPDLAEPAPTNDIVELVLVLIVFYTMK